MTIMSDRTRSRRRRGVILILVLGVLGLMAVIGVTFATFTGQAKQSSRSFMQGKFRPQGEELMDFALAQLISDTNDVRSAIRGHSLARDMYGNDANRNGQLEARTDGVQSAPAGDSRFYVTRADASGSFYQLTTNVVEGDPYFYGYNFNRWTIRIAYTGMSSLGTPPNSNEKVINQSFEVVGDTGFQPGSTNYRKLTVVIPPADVAARIVNPTTGFVTISPAALLLNNLASNLGANFRFTLDGRWLNAFNGPGRTWKSRYANFRFNGEEPGLVGMDEDYDAVDLENWFLAMQSADGQINIPSFHRPANVRYDMGPAPLSDWDNVAPSPSALRDKMSRILRPRQVDGHDPATFPDLIPNETTGKIEYDVDNDGDGSTDSVWVDLGYPARKNAQGNLYKPLFAFMVVGLNGRIPLNTAGNLAGRGVDSDESEATHASHLGNSVSEIDPTYGLQNAYDSTGVDYTQFDSGLIDVRLTQLRNILAGTRPQSDPWKPDLTGAVNGDANYVMFQGKQYFMPNGVVDAGDVPNGANVVRLTDAVPGRWGEPESVPGGYYAPLAAQYANEVRPGYSLSVKDLYASFTSGNPAVPADAADDDYNSFDVYPTPAGGRIGEVGDGDFYDPAGALLLPVERIRRFVTPIDVNGSGLITQFNSRRGGGGARNSVQGADLWGRVEYRGYYRPPGLPGQVDPASGAISYPWGAGAAYPNLRPSAANVANATSHNNNILHGFDSHLLPNTRGNPQRSGGILAYADSSAANPVPGVPTRMPTYDNKINSGIQDNSFNYQDDDGNNVSLTVRSRSDGLNEADEMNLYNVNTNLDAPYSHADLEWLYRSHDVDGTALTSRLSALAPISFTNAQDGMRRRRLYSIDTWESNAFAWANDNPPTAALPGGTFPANSRFNASANAKMGTTTYTPALAQRGRKINLNMPLPVSNDPDEPIRRKWIGDAYQMMKTVLPPRAVDTPEELAQLGQYLVNLIDFRDPDCAMTHWENPDVFFVPAAGAGGRPTLAFAGTRRLQHYGMEFNPIAINETLAYSYPRKEGTGPGRDASRFFLELVNTLSRPAGASAADNGSVVNLSGFNAAGVAPNNPYAGGCWDLVFTADGVESRPDPFTGQLQPGGTVYGLTPLGRGAITSKLEGGTSVNTNVDALMKPLPQRRGTTPLTWFGNDPYVAVFAYPFPGPGAERDSELYTPGDTDIRGSAPFIAGGHATLYTLAGAYDPFNAGTAPTFTIPNGVLPNDQAGNPVVAYPGVKIPRVANQESYFWVCLRRPANPLAPVGANNPMIVVDSMRFPLIDTGGSAQTDATDDPPNSGKFDVVRQGGNDLFSYQRLQPYRGGQAVPWNAAVAGAIDPRYGYTEQIAAPDVLTTGLTIVYGTTDSQKASSDGRQVSRRFVSHSLGLPNHKSITAGGTPNEQERWDFFPFHDRDFTSPFELTLVPGTPPGLFTKQFAEFAPSAANDASFRLAAAGALVSTRTGPITMATTPAGAASDRAANFFNHKGPSGSSNEPHSFPYLVDRFFYTAAGAAGITDVAYDAASGAGTVGGYAADGWHRMFDFFEVPSQSNGAIGSVAQGTNFDWARQDVRPGLMNLNLIIDEEVFLGLLGKQDMTGATPTFQQRLMNPYIMPTAENLALASPFKGGRYADPYNGSPAKSVPAPVGYPGTPLVVTAVLGDGAPAYAFPMASLGAIDWSDPAAKTGIRQFMKVAFAQFLWARHGGSGFLFGYGDGATGQNTVVSLPTPPTVGATDQFTMIPAERPFRSSSYPDVDFTVLRPAALPPSAYTDPPLAAGVSDDPGVRSPGRFFGYDRSVFAGSTPAGNSTFFPPPIPARRLFQVPDGYTGASPSNAGVLGDAYVNRTAPFGAGNPAIGGIPPITIASGGSPINTNDGSVNLFVPDANTPPGYDEAVLGSAGGNSNQAQHPFFRGELMQRVYNLTTVRTHQFAVWITIGFFEVRREGDIAMIGSAYPSAAFDVLGPEIGAATGQNTRFRSFFVVDRLKLTGFDPDSVGSYRPAVVYRRTIE